MLPTAVYAPPTGAAVLNYALVGNLRSGTSVVQTSLAGTAEAACHGDLFHAKAKLRRRCHERYFGPAESGEWFEPGAVNPCQYLVHRVFGTALRGESAVGLRLHYDAVQRWELYDLFREQYVLGDFCLVHVVRNPVACYVSQLQAERSRLWALSPNDPAPRTPPPPVSLDPAALTKFVRESLAVQAKLDRSSDDLLIVPYRELFRDPLAALREVYEFLEIPSRCPAPPGVRRLRNRPIRERIGNLESLRREVPFDVRAQLDADDLF